MADNEDDHMQRCRRSCSFQPEWKIRCAKQTEIEKEKERKRGKLSMTVWAGGGRQHNDCKSIEHIGSVEFICSAASAN